jgi:hypothetical protein
MIMSNAPLRNPPRPASVRPLAEPPARAPQWTPQPPYASPQAPPYSSSQQPPVAMRLGQSMAPPPVGVVRSIPPSSGARGQPATPQSYGQHPYTPAPPNVAYAPQPSIAPQSARGPASYAQSQPQVDVVRVPRAARMEPGMYFGAALFTLPLFFATLVVAVLALR